MTSSKLTFQEFFFKKRYLIAVILSAVILLASSCKKALEQKAQNYFENNYLNSDFVVDLASDSTADFTSQYAGYTFRLLKNTLSDGPATAVKNGITYTGTWSVNEDYSKLTININQPSVPAEFVFLNRAWRFASKELPVLKLTPWGSSAPVKLNLRRL
jgi:hypothetical protein